MTLLLLLLLACRLSLMEAAYLHISTRTVRSSHASMLAGFGKKPVPSKSVKPKFKGKETIQTHMRAYNKLVGGTSHTNQVDVYVRSSSTMSVCRKFWFVGKSLAADGLCDAVSAVVVQKRLILEHAKLLQQELALAKELQLWTAPRNSEIKVAERRQPLQSAASVRVTKDLITAALDGPQVGFEPEQYENARDGFFVRLQDDGTPPEGSTVYPRYVTPDSLAEELAKEGDKSTIII
ncbi:hypothetical protein AB1Y20_020306 [Prymnesium parvum]|uniref:Uncharacterized protein n=1 Tax=Prymnesium parvum TaxID=97485 RepID=A0AB34JT88_PRYPA